MLRGRSHPQKTAYYMTPFIWSARKSKTTATESKSMVVRGCGGRKGIDYKEVIKELSGSDEIILYFDCVYGYKTVYIYQDSLNCTFKNVPQ